MSQHEWTWTTSESVPSRLGAHLPLLEQILSELRTLGWTAQDLFGVTLALEETLANAIKHGNCLDETKHVLVDCKMSSHRFWIAIQDEGEGFDPDEVPDCTAPENLEADGGRGLLLIRTYMDVVHYNEAGNCVTMEKSASPQEQAPDPEP